jgi:hypothetical protein
VHRLLTEQHEDAGADVATRCAGTATSEEAAATAGTTWAATAGTATAGATSAVRTAATSTSARTIRSVAVAAGATELAELVGAIKATGSSVASVTAAVTTVAAFMTAVTAFVASVTLAAGTAALCVVGHWIAVAAVCGLPVGNECIGSHGATSFCLYLLLTRHHDISGTLAMQICGAFPLVDRWRVATSRRFRDAKGVGAIGESPP